MLPLTVTSQHTFERIIEITVTKRYARAGPPDMTLNTLEGTKNIKLLLVVREVFHISKLEVPDHDHKLEQQLQQGK